MTLENLDINRITEEEEPTRTSPRPRFRKRRLLLGGLLALYTLFLAVQTLIVLFGGENWWWGSFNLIFPQWFWSLPGFLLLIPCWLWLRKWSWVPLVCLVWVFWPLMGWQWHFHGGAEAGTKLRVMTYNVKRGSGDINEVLNQIKENHPDVLIVQEPHALRDLLVQLAQSWGGYEVKIADQYLIVSRFPLSEPELVRVADGYNVIRCRATIGGKSVTIYDAHLLSPRYGFMALRHPRSQGFKTLQENNHIRLEQAHELAAIIGKENGPVLLAGDLNAPVQALACRALFDAGLTDAFNDAGRGYGYSYGHTIKYFGYSFVRIDHIMTNRFWQTLDCFAGREEGSDHRPVIADLVLKQ